MWPYVDDAELSEFSSMKERNELFSILAAKLKGDKGS
jgi:hypothetical protein